MDGMTEEGTTEPAGLSERPQEAGGDKSAGGPPPQRFSAKRKLRAVSRLLRGQPLELVAWELDVTAARLSQWRERALLAAEAALKERERDIISERTQAGLAARARGRKGGRPKKAGAALTPYNERKSTIDEICSTLNISRATFIEISTSKRQALDTTRTGVFPVVGDQLAEKLSESTIGLSYQVIAILTGFLLPSDRGCPYQVIVDQSVSTSSLGVTRSCNGPTK